MVKSRTDISNKLIKNLHTRKILQWSCTCQRLTANRLLTHSTPLSPMIFSIRQNHLHILNNLIQLHKPNKILMLGKFNVNNDKAF